LRLFDKLKRGEDKWLQEELRLELEQVPQEGELLQEGEDKFP